MVTQHKEKRQVFFSACLKKRQSLDVNTPKVIDRNASCAKLLYQWAA
jgi:hypothetical protein